MDTSRALSARKLLPVLSCALVLPFHTPFVNCARSGSNKHRRVTLLIRFFQTNSFNPFSLTDFSITAAQSLTPAEHYYVMVMTVIGTLISFLLKD